MYEIQELTDDPTRTIQKSFLTSVAKDEHGTVLKLPGHKEVIKTVAFDRSKDP
jgi:hypothetical protein